VDLYGDELAQPIEVFQPVYAACRMTGLRLTAHVGEWGSAQDVARAVEVLELDSVQHGIAAASAPSVMRRLAEQRVTLNVCPTSNVRLGRVEHLGRHPIRTLFDAGVRVTVNTDDALVFGIGVSEEFLGLYRAGAPSERPSWTRSADGDSRPDPSVRRPELAAGRPLTPDEVLNSTLRDRSAAHRRGDVDEPPLDGGELSRR
jgi:hypothetical protein